MARKCGETQTLPLNQQDLEYAQDLLEWSRSLKDHKLTWEKWESARALNQKDRN